jgi:hypothetical protein
MRILKFIVKLIITSWLPILGVELCGVVIVGAFGVVI